MPFAELLPFRGFARKIFDGVETNLPTWHGVVVRTDFAEKYPEVVVAYIKAIIEANAWLRTDPEARGGEDPGVDRDQQGGGLHLPRPRRQHDHRPDHQAGADRRRRRRRQGAAESRPHEGVRHQEVGRRQLHPQGLCRAQARLRRAAQEHDELRDQGHDKFCKKPIGEPRKAGEVWIDGEGIEPFSSAACTLGAYADFKAKGKKINVAYVFDTARGIKLFADQAFFAVGGDKTEIAPFLLKKDAEAFAAKNGGKVLSFEDALKAAVSGG